MFLRNSIFSSLVSDSGATYRSFAFPERTSFLTLAISAFVRDELRKWATSSSVLKFLIASTWFFIRAIRGEITIAIPFFITAGS